MTTLCIALGVFRQSRLLPAARSFVGMMVHHPLIQSLLGAKPHQDFDAKEIRKTLTDIWLDGVQIRDGPPVEAQRKGGKNAHDAIYEGALIRFRPIMMTTKAALMGTLPIALGFGAGSESRRPLGLAVVCATSRSPYPSQSERRHEELADSWK